MRLSAYGHGRGRPVAVLRCAVGIWLVSLCVYLSARGSWLGLLFLVPAAAHFYLAYRAMRSPHGR
jgi:hypothetical protein